MAEITDARVLPHLLKTEGFEAELSHTAIAGTLKSINRWREWISLFIAIASTAQINPVPPALGASHGFLLPVPTPPNAIVYSSHLGRSRK